MKTLWQNENCLFCFQKVIIFRFIECNVYKSCLKYAYDDLNALPIDIIEN